jgi:pimeloyl-ACP methyl ester carboxylesterase
VRDLLALLEHARVEAPILVGWSMGVQLALELHRAHAKLPRALVGIHGTCGRPFDTAFDSRWSAVLAPRALALLARLPREQAARVGPRLARAPGIARGFTWLCRGLGLMAPQVDVDAFRAVAEEWTQLDFAAYAETFEWLARHDASDLLPKIATPTLLVAGGRDPLTPARLSRGMACVMPDAELCLIPEATHFGLIEAPDRIAEQVADFLRRRLALQV